MGKKLSLLFVLLSVLCLGLHSQPLGDFIVQGSVTIPTNTALPEISGSDVVGSVLTCSTGSWTGPPTSFSFKWYRDNVFITGETNNTYTSVAIDSYLGSVLKCGVIATNSSGSSSEVFTANFQTVINPTSLAVRYYSADNAFQDLAKTIPATNGVGVRTIEDQTADVDLDWIGTIVGNVQHQNNNDYGDTDPYPKFHSEDGGFVHISNTLAQKFETSTLSYAGASYMLYYVRLTGGTDNEYWFFVSNGGGVRDRDAGTGTTTQVGSWNTFATLTTGGRALLDVVYENALIGIVRDGSGNGQLYINGATWGENIAVGSNTMTEHAWGSNSHNANISFFGSAIITGTYSSTVAGQFQKLWEKKHGVVGTYSVDYPVATFNSGGTYNDQETWNGTDKTLNAPAYVFNSPIGAAEGASECRFYTSSSASQATAIGQRTYVGTKIRGVDTNFTKWYRGTDYGVSAGTPTNVFCWMEITAVDQCGNRQVVATQTQGIKDSGL